MSTPATPPSVPLSVYMEPYVYTSTQTKFGQQGYQVLIRGSNLLDPLSSDYTALVTLLKQAGQMPIAKDADPGLIYAPIGRALGAFICITWIKDWRGRFGAAASALVFKHSDIEHTTPAELGDHLRRNPQLFLTHNRAVRMVEEDVASKTCPIARTGIDLQVARTTAPVAAASDLPALLASAETLWSDRQRAGAPADDDNFARLRTLLWLAPRHSRMNTSFVWNAAGDLPLPLPAIYLWRPGAERSEVAPFPATKEPSSTEAAALLKQFGRTPQRIAGMAAQVIRQGGGQERAVPKFWREIADQFSIEQILDGDNFLDAAVSPDRVAHALDALQRGAPEQFDRWIAENGARLFAQPERFRAVLGALFAQREAFKATLTRLRQQLSGALVPLLEREGLEAPLALYGGDIKLVEPLLLAATERWSATAAPPANWNFLGRLGDRLAWGRILARPAPWLDAALRQPAFRQIAEELLAESAADAARRDRVSRHFWKAAQATGDQEVITWALRQTVMVASLDITELDTIPDQSRRELAGRFREAAAKGMELSLDTCWALLRSPRSNPELRSTIRDYLLLKAREGARFGEDQLADYIQSLDRDVPNGFDPARMQQTRREMEEMIRLNCDEFSDLHTFEHRFLGLRVKRELERFGCDVQTLAGRFGRASRRAEIAGKPVPAPGAPATRAEPRDPWLRRHASTLVGVGGALALCLLGWATWQYFLSPEAEAGRKSEALSELKPAGEPSPATASK